MMQLFENSVTWFKSDSDVIWFAAFWGGLAILGALEVMVPAFQRAPERLHRWPTNFSLGVINSIVMPLAPVSAVWGADWAYTHGIGFLNQIAHPWWIAVAVTLAVRSLAGYLVHVLMHKVPLLWRLHRVHHLDTHLDISTSLRSHPAEYVVNLVIIVPAAIVFGMTPWVLIIYELTDTMVSVFSHANLRMPQGLDRWLRWVLVTPNMHSLHHSSYQPETDSNYGTVFTFWDRLFRTYRHAPARSYDELQIGLTEIRDQRAWDLWWQLKSPALSIPPASAASPDDPGLIGNHANR
jgi:sterol desaturase/sphingolipid hydroxylase (fatty acid hydroxylase superfamily)